MSIWWPDVYFNGHILCDQLYQKNGINFKNIGHLNFLSYLNLKFFTTRENKNEKKNSV